MREDWFAGVDWGGETHHVCVLDASGEVAGEHAFKHGGEGLAAMADWILSRAGRAEADAIGVAIEVPHGPVVESLMGRGFAIHAINPKQLDRFRDRFSVAGAKDDRRDARVLASALRTDPQCLRRLEPTDAEIVELREWSRIRKQLVDERTRLSNQMRDQLWRYYPQFLDAVEDDLAKPWALSVWRRLPTPEKARRVRPKALAMLLKKHRIRRLTGAELRDRLRAEPIQLSPGTAEAAVDHIRVLLPRLELVNQQLADANRRLKRLVQRLADPAPTDASEEADEGEINEQRDAGILRSLPGVGTVVLATLLAEADVAIRHRDYFALRCLCGVAPVTKLSSKKRIVVRRLAANKRLCDAAYNCGRVAIQHDPVCRAKYDTLRARGHKHPRALRTVMDRLLGVACAMLRDRTLFDPDHARTAMT